MDQAWLAAQMAEIEALKVEAMGMAAENDFRKGFGETPAYGGAAFNAIAEQIRCIAQAIWINR